MNPVEILLCLGFVFLFVHMMTGFWPEWNDRGFFWAGMLVCWVSGIPLYYAWKILQLLGF